MAQRVGPTGLTKPETGLFILRSQPANAIGHHNGIRTDDDSGSGTADDRSQL